MTVPSSHNIRVSVIVPAHRAAHLLPDTLGALRASQVDALDWELIVVDDGSDDATATVAAALSDRVISLPAPARGPGAARNAGAAVARGEWLLFVDADVRVHPNTLHRFVDSVATHPNATAIFGAYDARPAGEGLVSRYRNLLHRYVHLCGAGLADSFWAGLGGVRRDRFLAVGGFDAQRYAAPAIEDIELGYRLRDAGDTIVLDPRIQAKHLKCWTFRTMARTDFVQRALPWMQLLLERRGQEAASLNVRGGERLRVALGGLTLVATPVGLWLSIPHAWWLSPLFLGATLMGSLPLLAWLRTVAGLRLVAVALPLQAWYYLSNAVAASIGIVRYGVRAVTAQPERPA